MLRNNPLQIMQTIVAEIVAYVQHEFLNQRNLDGRKAWQTISNPHISAILLTHQSFNEP